MYNLLAEYHGPVTKRGQTFPVPEWWVALVRDRTSAHGSQQGVTQAVKAKFGAEIDGPEMTRIRKGERVTIDMSVWVSDVLGIPPPLFIASTEREARAFLAERVLLRGVSPQVDALRAGVVAEENVRQPTVVQPDHETSRPGGKRRRVGPVRAGPSRS